MCFAQSEIWNAAEKHILLCQCASDLLKWISSDLGREVAFGLPLPSADADGEEEYTEKSDA